MLKFAPSVGLERPLHELLTGRLQETDRRCLAGLLCRPMTTA